MAGGSKSANVTKSRKRVEAETPNSTSSPSAAVLKRSKSGSAFTRCEDCNKDVAMALIDFHSCSLDAKIKMNLEAQVVEIVPKKAEKRKATKSTSSGKTTKKKVKNVNGRKRPQTAFFVFMDDFRKSFKAENPDCKSVATVAKEGGEKWKSMSDEEKKVYVDRAAELKAEYEKACEEDENEKDGDEIAEVVEVEDDEVEGDNEDGEENDGEIAEIEVKKEKIEVDDDDDE